MAAIDIFFIVLILIAAARGYFRGFIKEILSVAGPVLAILSAIFLSKPLAGIIAPLFPQGGALGQQIVAFLVLFIAVYLVIFLIQKALHGLVEKFHLVGADRALGVLLGLVEGVTAVFLITIVLLLIPLPQTRGLLAGSFFRGLVAPFLPELLSAARPAGLIFYV